MKGVKDRKLQTATFKQIGLPECELFENQEEKQFAETYTKQATIDKVNTFQFQNKIDNCKFLIDCLLKEYDLWHPENQATPCQSITDSEHQPKSYTQIRENTHDSVGDYENQHNINETQNSNIKLKSNIIFLELENKKLQLKQKLLEKKYQKQTLEVNMAPNLEVAFRKSEKQLLQIQLDYLKELKSLSEKLEEFKRPSGSSSIIDLNSNFCESNLEKIQQPVKKKKKQLKRSKIFQYLISKVKSICKDQFIEILDKIQGSLGG